MREAPSIPLIEALLGAGARVHAYDPEASKVARGIFGSKVTYAPSNYDALKGADALAIVTEWNEFRRPDFERMRSLMRAPVIFDGRNLFAPTRWDSGGSPTTRSAGSARNEPVRAMIRTGPPGET
jgi:UDPglucose 6-dehydrogenase